MLNEFHEALIAEPQTLYGRPLRRFSLGHAVLLHAIDSPFRVDGVLSAYECFKAVGICSRTFEDARLWLFKLSRQDCKKEFKQWFKQNHKGSVDAIVEQLNEYFTAFLQYPKFWEPDDTSKQPKLPTELLLATALMKQLHFTESQAWNCPYGLAVWYVTAASGNDKMVVSDEEDRIAERLRQTQPLPKPNGETNASR